MNHNQESTKYNSSISTGLVVFISITLLGSSAMTILDKAWLAFAIMIVVSLFIAYLFLTTYYLITDSHVIIKMGFIKKSVDIAEIKDISDSNSSLSSPALSFNRIKITYKGYHSILISPKDKSGFLDHLKSINPGITVSVKMNS